MHERPEVLIIDDETEIRLDLAEILTSQGYRVTTARNGEEAIQHLRSGHRLPDLITLDYLMPKKDGLAFYRELESLNLQKIPLIFLSGYLPPWETGPGTIFLSKPIDRLELLAAVEQLTQKAF